MLVKVEWSRESSKSGKIPQWRPRSPTRSEKPMSKLVDRVQQFPELLPKPMPTPSPRILETVQIHFQILVADVYDAHLHCNSVRNLVVVLELVLCNDVAVLPVDCLVAFDSRRAEEAAVYLVCRDAVVAFVFHFAFGRPWSQRASAELVVAEFVVRGEDGGKAENGR